MNYSANFIDKYSAQSAAAVFHEGEIKELATTLLKDFKLEIYENLEHYKQANEMHFNP